MRFRSDSQRKAVMARLRDGRTYRTHRPHRIQAIKSSRARAGRWTKVSQEQKSIRYERSPDKPMIAAQRFDLSKAKRLTSGRDRVVMELPDGKIIKIAKNKFGLMQNDSESGNGYLEGSLLPQLYEAGLDYVVVEKAGKDPKVINPMLKIMRDKETYDAIAELDEKYPDSNFSSLGDYTIDNRYNHRINSEIAARRQWGVIDGRPVLVDGGALLPPGDLDKRSKQAPQYLDTEWRDVLAARRQAKQEGKMVVIK